MYFKEKEDTNIDSEFDDEKKFHLNKKLLLIIVGIILLIIIIIVVINLLSNKSKYTIDLIGEEEIIINLGDDYIEPGYTAIDKNGFDVSDQVEITSDVDYSKPGTYEILYSIDGVTAVRYITILKQNEETEIYLLGDLTTYLKVGEKYVEPGYKVVDAIDGDIKDKVKVTGAIDTNKKGVYLLTYTVTNSRNITVSKVRVVVVE